MQRRVVRVRVQAQAVHGSAQAEVAILAPQAAVADRFEGDASLQRAAADQRAGAEATDFVQARAQQLHEELLLAAIDLLLRQALVAALLVHRVLVAQPHLRAIGHAWMPAGPEHLRHDVDALRDQVLQRVRMQHEIAVDQEHAVVTVRQCVAQDAVLEARDLPEQLLGPDVAVLALLVVVVLVFGRQQRGAFVLGEVA